MSSKSLKKSTTKYRSKKPIVPKWKLFRANEPFLCVFMWGINHSGFIEAANPNFDLPMYQNDHLTGNGFISAVNSNFDLPMYQSDQLTRNINELSHVPPPTLLMPDDFKAFSKVKIDNHHFNKDNMPSHFKIKEYCPNVFRNLREKFGIEERDYLKSLTKNQPEPTDSPGRSQAKFYISFNGTLVVKSLCAEEVAEVHSILQDYHEYVVEKHGKTLLPQFLGLYRLTVESIETYLMVTRNVFGSRYPVHKKYDLKGSTVQRSASDKEKVKKCKLYLADDAKQILIQMLAADCEFLSKLRLMDYSLLIGIHDCSRPREDVFSATYGGDSSEPDAGSLNLSDFENPTPPESPRIVPNEQMMGTSPLCSSGVFPLCTDDTELMLDDQFYAVACKQDCGKKEVYFIGLVDILTYYGMKKKTATAAKTVKYGAAEAENISTVRPHQYAKRLVDFVGKSVVALNGIHSDEPMSPGL